MKKKVLIIDDSALMRRVLSDIINSDGRFQVTGTAADGLEGLYLLLSRAEEFDAILLDINMPRMSGIELLEQLKERGITAKIIIVSTIVREDAQETIRALELGAFDFVTKPESYVKIQSSAFYSRLLECLAAVAGMGAGDKPEAVKAPVPRPKAIPPLPARDAVPKADALEASLRAVREAAGREAAARETVMFPAKVPPEAVRSTGKLVALACSTGGPKALHTVIPNLPANLDAAVLVVQHMPGGFTKSLADRLNELSPLTVKEAEDGEILTKGTVYIAKGGYQLRLKTLEDHTCRLSVIKERARHGLQPCADIMYESLVDSEFGQIVCVVLTGMGGDGTAGIKQLERTRNIYVIAQNEETSVVYGMPKVVRDAGLVDEVVALNEVSGAIIKNVGVC